jgi:acyl transferase domain-containing protein
MRSDVNANNDSGAAGTDIAVVGLSGRFPGAADVPEFWSRVRDGYSGITRFTDQELRAAGVGEDLLADPGYVKANPVLDGVELFDAAFFGFSPKEAQILDPQHRLFLEHSWHALEDAGCDPVRFAGAVGVFGGTGWSSYLQNNLGPSGVADVVGHLAVGLANDKDSLATRVSYTLGLTGPSYAVQSFCSTSLVAVCAAASSLAGFECDLALAGGVTVAVPHRVGYLYQPGGIASPDAECRAFDASGLGAPTGSGVGVVALRRLEDALADGDRVYAVIRGWAVNNDGARKVGFTAPGVHGQAAVIAEALSAAGLAPADVDYIEAHGTGTALGDAVEIAALQQVFRGGGCLIGSVKTNVGHLDRAAGVASLIKTSLAVRDGQIPPTRNLADPNPQLTAGDARLEVVTALRDWPQRAGRPRRAGVSAFGIGGTNAHVVLEQAPAVARPAAAARPEVLVWSARSENAVAEMTARLADHVAGTLPGSLGDTAYTLQTGRRVFEQRRMLIAADPAAAAAAIRSGEGVLAAAEPRSDREVAFLIAGVGEQYPGMAAELYRAEPEFRTALDECRALLSGGPDGADPLAAMLAPRRSGAARADGFAALMGRGADRSADTEPTELLQPAVFAVEYALARLLMSWGVRPSMMAGYSVGEYVAACLSGVLDLESALALVQHRARLIGALPPGAMAAVPLAEAGIRERLARGGIADVDIAAVNGPALTVVAGPAGAVQALRDLLAADAVPCRPLATEHAFHSRMLEPAKAELTAWVAANVKPGVPEIAYLSNVTGAPVTADQVADPGYWAEHMCSTVQFDAVLGALLDGTDAALLELGPGQSLGAMARGHRLCPPERWRHVVSTLPAADDPRPADAVVAEAAGRLWLAGVPIDWTGLHRGRHPVKVALPGYPFQRQRYWVEPPAPGAAAPGATHRAVPAFAAPEPASVSAPVSVSVSASAPDRVRLMSPQWTQTALGGEAAQTGRCTILGDAGLAAPLAEALRAAGADVARIAATADRDTLAAHFAQTTPSLVVDLRALPAAARDADGRDAVMPVAALADALGSAVDDTVRVLIATRGGHVIAGSGLPAPDQAAVSALPVVVNQEYMNLACRAVDLDPDGDVEACVLALAEEAARVSPDVLAAYRGGRRHTREFVVCEAGEGADTPAPIRPGGTYLITGGLGAVGLIVAEHLVRRGAAKLVLTSRSGEPAEPGDPRAAALRRLRDLGAQVLAPAADATDEAGMREALAAAVADGGKLDGVIHAAAEARPDTFLPLRYLNREAVEKHFAAKTDGARILAALLAELPAEQAPDFCLLFSSTSAILGGMAFGSYSAANAALTAAGRRHGIGAATRWIAAGWDTWSDTLKRLEGGVGATMSAHAMSAPEALDALDRLLAAPRPEVFVVAAGLADRLPRATAGTDDAADATASAAFAPLPGTERFPRPDLPQPYSPPLTAAERALAETWSDVLGVEPVGARDNFFDLGGNSLTALQMLALVKKRFQVSLPAVTLFEAPTVHALAVLLDGKAPAAALAAASPAGPRPTVSVDEDLDRRIAVVGMAGRFPGADGVDRFWHNLRGGVESISFFSEQELLESGVSPDEIRDPSYVPARPVLDDVSGFDAAFFGISPRTAALTDPQQRVFLEVCWEALEQAGYADPEHRGGRVGVYGGCNISTYLLRMPEETFSGGEVSTYEIVMGNDKDALTTMVSYLFDLYGPSVAVQTFCSTSLVAAHLAVRALRSGECELALAGGVSIRVPDKVGHRFGPGGMESPDGHVRTFDAQAKGSMFGDGAAVVVLKRLSDALRDGDHIWSVIRGSAMNNDGALKVGYTAPSVVGQARVIADALADARVTGEDISYIEAHGTATELGDPIELAALTRAFGPTEENQYCPIGSVKTNVGHLDRAAGVTGLIKTSFALTEQTIPPSLHYTSPNPDIDFAHSPFYVNSELSPWRTRGGRRPIAGINSLGMGGTNVHMVVERAPEREPAAPGDGSGRRFQVLPLSARSGAAADEACRRLGEHLAGPAAPARLHDVAYTLQIGRKTFEHRRVLVAGSVAGAAAALAGGDADEAARTPAAPSLLRRVDAARGRPVAFLFAGVGEQYPGLVAELARREPVFRAALDECLHPLRAALPDADLDDLLTGERGSGADLAALLGRSGGAGPGSGHGGPRAAALARTEVAQPAVFAVEYALARTLLAWGVRPQVMMGYSLGEYVAACLAGVLTLPDALALVAHRAKLIGSVAAGSMAAVPLAAAELGRRYGLAGRGLDVAAVNGPAVTVVAGPPEAVELLAKDLAQDSIPCRPLDTSHAFHSRMLEPLREDLTAWVRGNVTLNPPQLPYISNVTGALATADLVCDPGYWARHMCETVQFGAGAQTLLAEPELAVLELGPGQSLGALIRSADCPPQRFPLILAALSAAADPRPDDAALADCLARLWLLGVDVDWDAHHGRVPGLPAGEDAALPGRIPLPTYAFQRQRYWFAGASRVLPAARGADAPQHGREQRGQEQHGPGPSLATLDAIAGLPKLPEDQWLQLPVWRQTASPAPAATQPASWLVFTREGRADDAVDALRARLRDAATPAAVSLVRPGDAYRAGEDGYTIRPGDPDDLRALLRDLREAGRPLDRVLHLWSLDAQPGTGADLSDGAPALAAGLHTLVALARVAGELGMDSWSLDVAACGTQQVQADDEEDPYSATLTGPCRVIPLEYPRVAARLIDLAPRPGAPALAALAAELAGPHGEPVVALRRGRRWVPRYETMPAPAADPSILREDGVYLITGGLGGIGLAMAERLAAGHRARLVLLARSGLPERSAWPAILAGDPGTAATDERTRERVARVSALLERGAEVEIVVGDASDRADVRRAYDAALERFGALHGVIHAAAVPSMGLMQFKQAAELDRELAPKVAGALALAEALRLGRPDEHELDFLVFFSSITSATGGGPGQAGYCAANAFLDSYARRLSAGGRRVLSIDWSEWTWNAWDQGLGGYTDSLQAFFRENRARIGIDFDAGWRSLLRVLACPEPHLVVCSQDFTSMVEFSKHFTVEAVTSRALTGQDGTRHPRPDLVTPYQQPSGDTEEAIARLWCESLSLEEVGALDSFFDLGGNSLLGVGVVAGLRERFALAELPPHILYEAPTVAALAVLVDASAGGGAGGAGPAGGGAAGSPAEAGGSLVRAQLRRSGLEAAAGRRRAPDTAARDSAAGPAAGGDGAR